MTTDSPHRPPVTRAHRTPRSRPAPTPTAHRHNLDVRHTLTGCPAAAGSAPCLCVRATR